MPLVQHLDLAWRRPVQGLTNEEASWHKRSTYQGLATVLATKNGNDCRATKGAGIRIHNVIIRLHQGHLDKRLAIVKGSQQLEYNKGCFTFIPAIWLATPSTAMSAA